MRIGIDTGGTFTDVVIQSEGTVTTFKVPSTPSDPSAAILGALADPRAGAPDGVRELVHGSTVATNALLEGRVATVALVITEGFEDILEIGRQDRPSLYDIEVQRPRCLVPRELRFGVPERILATGEVRTPLDIEAVRNAGRSAARAGAGAIVVCFLHSYLRPDHEIQAGEALAGLFDGPISLSHAIVREFREYERCSTAAVNAALSPVMGAYLMKLAGDVGGSGLRVMCSSGGSASPERAAAEAVTTVLSGPAAGVVAAHAASRRLGLPRMIAFDMGGTSTEVSLIPGEVRLTGDSRVAGHPIRTPSIDIHTVGAGGGSIAWIDAGGALKVGPASAAADPGPACYGMGGPATVTDANLLLGRLLPGEFLGGRMKLDPEASARALGELAGRMGISAQEAASGIIDVANVTMARAIRQVSLFRGHDPSEFVLCSYGGAGGLHCAELAEAAAIAKILVPPGPGVLSAWGLLAGDLALARSATILREAGSLGASGLRDLFAPLEAECRSVLAAELGAAPTRIEIRRTVEARYRGQSHELTLPSEGWIEAFHDLHEKRFGFARRDEPVMAVTIKVIGRCRTEPPALPGAGVPAARGKDLSARVWQEGGWAECRVAHRSSIIPGERLEGPVVIPEEGSTTWVPRGWRADALPDASLLMEPSS